MSHLNRPIRRLIRSRRFRQSALANGVAQETAKSYVAGNNLYEAAALVAKLRKQGLVSSLSYLPTPEVAPDTVKELSRALSLFGPQAAGMELSVKPSALGLREDPAAAAESLRGLALEAAAVGAYVTLEMQGPQDFDATLDLWRDVHADVATLGITMPVDILRAEQEIGALAAAGARVRLCIGSYHVPRGQGYRREQDKSLALVRCLRTLMEGGGYAMVASHDPTVIAITQELAHRNGIGPDGFEFQMLLGVRPLEQRRLVDIGYRCRVYLPYGEAWFDYLTMRISARPGSAYNYLRALADKR